MASAGRCSCCQKGCCDGVRNWRSAPNTPQSKRNCRECKDRGALQARPWHSLSQARAQARERAQGWDTRRRTLAVQEHGPQTANGPAKSKIRAGRKERRQGQTGQDQTNTQSDKRLQNKNKNKTRKTRTRKIKVLNRFSFNFTSINNCTFRNLFTFNFHNILQLDFIYSGL